MRMRAVKLKITVVILVQLTLLFLMFTLTIPSPSHATVFFDTSFEACTVGTGNDFPCEGWDDFKQERIGAEEVVSGVGFSGSKFMRHFSNGPSPTDQIAGNTFKPSIYHTLPDMDYLFMRVAMRFSNPFQFCDNGHTKLIRFRAGATPNLWLYNRWGSYALVMEAPYDYAGTYVLQTSIVPTKGGWDQIEVEWKLNTPGQSNGHLRLWINGVLRAEQLNKAYRGPTPSSRCGNGSNICASDAVIKSMQIYNQCMSGTIDYDRIAIGDTRIGLATSQRSSDTNPPTVPSGIQVR